MQRGVDHLIVLKTGRSKCCSVHCLAYLFLLGIVIIPQFFLSKGFRNIPSFLLNDSDFLGEFAGRQISRLNF